MCVVCTLSLSHIREVKCPRDQIVINHMTFLQNRHLTKYDASLYIKNFIR